MGFWDDVGDGNQQPGGGAQSLLNNSLGDSSPQSGYWSLPHQNEISSGFRQASSRFGGAPTGMGREAFLQNAQSRLEQQKVIQALQQQARGDLNSLAQQQLGQSYGQAKAGQSSLGSTMRGQGAGAAMRGIQQGQQGIQRGFAGDQQMLMAQEQQAAQAMLAQMLQQQREQDLSFSGAQAGALLNSQGLNDEMLRTYGQLESSLLKGNQGAALDSIRAELGLEPAQRALMNQYAQSFAGAGATAAGGLSSMSWGGSQPAFRQVDGENSIVPFDDK